MQRRIPIRRIDANVEVLARIVKAASKKYDCTVKIDFRDGRCDVEFVGDETCKPVIAAEVEQIFRRPNRPVGPCAAAG